LCFMMGGWPTKVTGEIRSTECKWTSVDVIFYHQEMPRNSWVFGVQARRLS
jgi:hypothetical protein